MQLSPSLYALEEANNVSREKIEQLKQHILAKYFQHDSQAASQGNANQGNVSPSTADSEQDQKDNIDNLAMSASSPIEK